MKSVVVYSKNHFNPSCGDTHATSSTASLASAVFEAASDVSEEVLYLDADEAHRWPAMNRVDFLVSIERPFRKAIRHFRPRHSLLFAVNQETRASRYKVLSPVLTGKLPPSALDIRRDLIGRRSAPARLADSLLLVGDALTLGTYLQSGRDLQSTYVVPYGTEGIVDCTRARSVRDSRIVLASSYVGIRKGSDFLGFLLNELSNQGLAHVEVVALGPPSNRFWDHFLRRYEREFPNFSHIPWLDPKNGGYQRFLQRSKLAVVPSREEGLVGTAVECIRSGIPTLTTAQAGLACRPLQQFLFGDDPRTWAKQTVREYNRVTSQHPTSDIDNKLFQNTNVVKTAIRRLIRGGSLWPNFYVFENVGNIEVGLRPASTGERVETWLQRQIQEDESLRDVSSQGRSSADVLTSQARASAVIAAVHFLESDNTLTNIYIRPGNQRQSNEETHALNGMFPSGTSVQPFKARIVRENKSLRFEVASSPNIVPRDNL